MVAEKELYEMLDVIWDVIPEQYDERFIYLVRWLIRADEQERQAVRRWLKLWKQDD